MTEQAKGPYHLIVACTAQHIEDQVNELFKTWKYWMFLGHWQMDGMMYRELMKMPDPTAPSGLAVARQGPVRMN